MKGDIVKDTVGSFWESLAEGWRNLADAASNALTRFRAGDKTQLPDDAEIDDMAFWPARNWALIGGDVFEDEQRVVVKLEVPGVDKDDLSIEVRGDTLIVSGEKRFEKESTEGRWRVMQCAYGSFHRAVPLPAAVRADDARATYRNGVLRVELPKMTPGKPKSIKVAVR